MIRYYAGVEGSGKSCMMTRDLFRHAESGGRVLTFPGYELYGKSKKNVISDPILPEQLLELITGEREEVDIIREQRIAVGIDEVPNFFNHHTWYFKINDILTSILQQRRKLGVAICMTGPIFEELPADTRRMIHEVIHCMDAHTVNHDISRGQTCIYYKEDKRGLLSYPGMRFSRKMKFRMDKWKKHYDTYAAISPLNQYVKVKFQNKEVVVDDSGNVVGKDSELSVQQNETINKRIAIAAKVAEWEQEGKEIITPTEYKQAIASIGFTKSRLVNNEFQARGLSYDPTIRAYRLLAVDIHTPTGMS